MSHMLSLLTSRFLGFLSVMIVPVAFVMTFFMFIAACIVSVGYNTFCKEIVNDVPSIKS